MRKLLLSAAASLALLAMMAGPAYATVIASVDIVNGTFEYNGAGGLNDPDINEPTPPGYVLVANGTYENLVFPDSGLNVPRNYILSVDLSAQLAGSPDSRPIGGTFDLGTLFGPLSLNQIMDVALDYIDVAYTRSDATSGTFSFGLEEDENLDLIPIDDIGEGVFSGHVTLRTAVPVPSTVPAPSTVGLMLLGLGLLAMGFAARRRSLFA